jgi:hypothetical protein
VVLVTWGIIVTVVPGKIWTPFHAQFTMPSIGWKGVFSVAIVSDLIAAVLAFFVLRKMKAPVLSAEQAEGGKLQAGVVPGAA